MAGGTIAGAALTERFGPGIATGLTAGFVSAAAGGGGAGEQQAAIVREFLKPMEDKFEALANTVAEVTSFLSAVLATRSQLGAEMATRSLVSDDPSFEGIGDIGMTYFKVNRAVAKVRKRQEFLERKAFNEGLGGSIGQMLGESMSK